MVQLVPERTFALRRLQGRLWPSLCRRPHCKRVRPARRRCFARSPPAPRDSCAGFARSTPALRCSRAGPHRAVCALVPPLSFGRRHPAVSLSACPDPHSGGKRDTMIPRARFTPLLGHPAKLGCDVLPMCAVAVVSKSQWVVHVCHG